jgi:hypothetical protein
MGNPSPRPQDESSRQYERLLKGEISPKQYVESLRKDARSRVASRRASSSRRRTAA